MHCVSLTGDNPESILQPYNLSPGITVPVLKILSYIYIYIFKKLSGAHLLSKVWYISALFSICPLYHVHLFIFFVKKDLSSGSFELEINCMFSWLCYTIRNLTRLNRFDLINILSFILMELIGIVMFKEPAKYLLI